MAFEDKVTNGEIHTILRRLGVGDPGEDPMGLGIGLVWVAARRLGHPISWEDAESMTSDESDRVMTAADSLPVGTAQQRSAELTALLESCPPMAEDPS